MYGGYMAMQNAANRYLQLCAERGLAPVFSNSKKGTDFTQNENYWKLLIDRKMVDNVTGEIIEQQPVKPVFDSADVLGILNDELARYPTVAADQDYATRKVVEGFLSGKVKGNMSAKDIAKAMQTPVDNVTTTNIVAAADEMGVKLSDRKKEQNKKAIAIPDTDKTLSQTFVDDTLNSFGIENLGDWEHVQKRVFATLLEEDFFTDADSRNRIDINEGSGMAVETNKSGIDETFCLKNYGWLGRFKKIVKLATIRELPNAIKYGKLIDDDVRNEHGENRGTKYAYITYDTQVDGIDITIKLTVRKSQQKNKFWVHSFEAIRNASGYPADTNDGVKTGYKTADTGDSVPQDSDSVKHSDRSYAPTFYSQMGKVVDAIKPQKMGAGGVVSYLKGKGIKNEEIKWSGIEAFLEGKKSVTKEELQEFVAGSMLQIGEQMSGRATFVGDDGTTYESETAFKDAAYAIADKEGIARNRVKFVVDMEDDMAAYAYVGSPMNQILTADISDAEGSSPRWGHYKLDGGENYRELVFTMPNSSYYNQAMRTHWGDEAEGVLAHARTATAAAVFYLAYMSNLGATVLQASTNSALNGTVTNGTCVFSGGAMYNATHKVVILNIPKGTTVDAVTVFPQAEYATEATDYEQNNNNKTFTPNADGTVDGIISLSPTMTILTDTANTIIECEYSRDANLVVAELLDLISRGTNARVADVTILADQWVGTSSPYSQVVAIDGVTENSQVDLTPDVEQLSVFYNKDLAFVTENENGVVTVYAIGQKPENDYTIQATITEVNV